MRRRPSAGSIIAGQGWLSSSTSSTSSAGSKRRTSSRASPRSDRIDQDDRTRNDPGSTSTAISPCETNSGERRVAFGSSTFQVSASREGGVSSVARREPPPAFSVVAATGSPGPVVASATVPGTTRTSCVEGASGTTRSSRLPSGVVRTAASSSIRTWCVWRPPSSTCQPPPVPSRNGSAAAFLGRAGQRALTVETHVDPQWTADGDHHFQVDREFSAVVPGRR